MRDLQKEVQFITDASGIVDLLQLLNKNEENIWIWQDAPKEKRKIYLGIVKGIDSIKEEFCIIPASYDTTFHFQEHTIISLYSKKQKMILRTEYQNLDMDQVVLKIPTKVGVLSEKLAKEFDLIEKENEADHLTQRQFKRKPATKEQSVTLEKIDEEENSIGLAVYILYDISPGGMGFRVEDMAAFKKGDRIRVLEINRKTTPKKLQGTITSLKRIDEESDSVKVGVQFDDD